jgi:hypothetical protein
MKYIISFLCICGLAWLSQGSPGWAETGDPLDAPSEFDRVVPRPQQADHEISYSMTARIRLLIPWLSFKDVGMAKIRWTESTGTTELVELLVGSDPLKAPMKVNRWGYLLEQRTDTGFKLVGVMTQSDEASVNEARKNLEPGEKVHIFKAIRTWTGSGKAESITHHIPSTHDFTFRDLEALLGEVPTSGGKERQLNLPPNTEPGFLYAVRSLIRESVEQYRQTGKPKGKVKPSRVYYFNGKLHELTLESAKLKRQVRIDRERFRRAIEGKFSTREVKGQDSQQFKIVFGTEDSLSEVPLQIVYRPKWWFEAVLQIDSPVTGG